MNKFFTGSTVLLNLVGALTWPAYWQWFFLGGVIAFSISLFVKSKS